MSTDAMRVPCPGCSKTMDFSCWPRCFDCREREYRAHCIDNDLCTTCGKALDDVGDCPRCYTCPLCEDALNPVDAVAKNMTVSICPKCADGLAKCAHCGDLHEPDDLHWIETCPGSREVPADQEPLCLSCSEGEP